MNERGHILKVLKEVQASLQEQDYIRIKSLSDKVIHSASIDQDPDVISVAVIIYSLSKLLERDYYKEQRNWPGFFKVYLKNINNLIFSLEKDNIEGFRKTVENIRISIEKLSGKLKIYIQDVFRKARINKASRIYEHGISMEKTAKILGISLWELAEYAGQTNVSDGNLAVTMPIRQRLKFAKEVFGL